MGRISNTNFKIRMVISNIATSKNNIDLSGYWSPVRSETGFVILDKKFWSRFDLQQRRNRKLLGDEQGCF
jgi:hypothetical protein